MDECIDVPESITSLKIAASADFDEGDNPRSLGVGGYLVEVPRPCP
jgi:hypothetical protein